jgi:hypothetical protein
LKLRQETKVSQAGQGPASDGSLHKATARNPGRHDTLLRNQNHSTATINPADILPPIATVVTQRCCDGCAWYLNLTSPSLVLAIQQRWTWRFTRHRLFIATTLLAVVLGMIAWLHRAWIGK